MPDRRTQSYAAVPHSLSSLRVDWDALSPLLDEALAAPPPTEADFARLAMDIAMTPSDFAIDPEDPVPELPPSPTFWPRDPPKDPTP